MGKLIDQLLKQILSHIQAIRSPILLILYEKTSNKWPISSRESVNFERDKEEIIICVEIAFDKIILKEKRKNEI